MPNYNERSSVYASNGMVASSQPLATQAGLRVLLDGGNAVDAALAVACVLGVVEPMMNGLGGDMFAIVWWEADRKVYGLNASGACPAGLTADRFSGQKSIPISGWESVTVPGAADGYTVLHDRFATRPLAELVAPAVAFARDGFPVGETAARMWGFLTPKLQKYGSDGYLIDGKAPRAGERFRHPELADSWELFGREGREGIYTGPVAREIVRASTEGGGGLTEKDLASQHAEWADPIGLDYRGLRVLEMPPNGQGIVALVALGILAFDDLASLSPADRMHLEIEAIRLGFAEADLHVGDPRCVEVDVAPLLTEPVLHDLRGRIDMNTVTTPALATRAQGDTTYMCAVDADGNAVSLITSLSQGFGSGVVAGKTGVMMNDRAAAYSLDPDSPNLIAPGRRPRHTILPAMALRDGRPEIVFGCMGGHMQPQGQLQTLVNVVDLGMGLQQAVDAPRFFVREQDDVAFDIETDPDLIADLEKRGHKVFKNDGSLLAWAEGFHGSAQMIRFHRDLDSLEAGSDPRLDGVALGY